MTRLEVDRISYSFGDYTAVDSVSFCLDPNELALLIGRNGSGKTTLLRCLAGWLEPAQGRVHISDDGDEKLCRSSNARVVLVPDTPPAYISLTAWEHLQLIGQVNRVPAWQQKSDALLTRFGLASHHRAMPAALSRGQRYKLALCMALLSDPQVLLLDEPFGPLDPLAVHALWQSLRELCKQGRTVLLSSHHLPNEIQPDRYLVMEDGKLIANGTPEQLISPTTEGKPANLRSILHAVLGE